MLNKILKAVDLLRCMKECPQWPSVIARYLRFGSPGYPFEFVSRRGGRLFVADWDELTTVWHVYFGNEYNLPSGSRTIVDLGANIGAFALWASEKFPEARIFSIEPYPSTYERLCRTVSDNRLEAKVFTLQMAIAGRDGSVSFDATKNKRSYCRGIVEPGQAAECIEVPSLTLASLLDKLQLPELDCLKMDIEGGEYSLFQSADSQTLRRVKAITMEYHDSSRATAIWKQLESTGFRRIRFAPGKWSGLATYERVE